MNTTILYKFNRESIESKDFTKFLALWNPAALPEVPHLRKYLNTFDFYVSGYDDDPRELFVIPKVRAFFREFNDKWPFWFFACNLDMPSLLTMTLCCLDTVQLTQSGAGEPWRADYKGTEMCAFLRQELRKMEALCRRAGMSPGEILHRRQRATHYFGMHPDLFN